MKLYLSVYITQPGGGASIMQKVFDDTEAVPMVGMDLEDPAWKEPRPIVSVTLNPIEPYYYVHMGLDSSHDVVHHARTVEMYELHGWRRPGGE